jgi:hypothetical protein
MAVGFSAAIANDVLDALCRNESLSTLPFAAVHIQLHIGDPGAAGTSNPAVNTTRHQATFGSVASGGTISNTVAITWTSGEVTASEDYTHYSAWSAGVAGTFGWSGLCTANAAVSGNPFVVGIGELDVTLSTAS